jgi:signal transduction histidine kinase
MSLGYAGALLCTVGLLGWIAVDVAIDPVRRRRLAPIGCLAFCALLWTCGELLLYQADSPSDRIAVRRVLFAGVCFLPVAWVWSALAAARPGAARRAGPLLAALALPGALAWACLFVDRGGWFIDWYAMPTRRGPAFFGFALFAWALIAAGTALLLRAAPPVARGGLGVRLAILASALLPLAANAEHVLLRTSAADPTPIAFGAAALLFRGIVLDFAWASAQPPLARAEVVAQMRDGVLVADAAGRIVDWNAASERILGDAPPGGRSLGAVLHELRRAHGPEIEIRRFALERRGRAFGDAAILADRTELRRTELRLELATRLEALGVLASGAAHEINNPLAYVSANLRLLERLASALAQPEVHDALPAALRARAREAPRLLEDCNEGVERIHRITEKLAAFAGATAAADAPEPLDLAVPVQKAIALTAFGRPGRRIALAPCGALPPVHARELDVLHLVLHLLLNALQMGGEEVPIGVALEASEKEACVRVSDAGPGIPEADLPHVFDPFFTTRRPGPNVGLGLSVCWELARRNGGRLEAQNRAEGGAEFTLWLPLADA